MPTIEAAGLIAYAGLREKALIMQMLMGMTAANDITFKTGIKSKQLLTKLTVASIMRPFTSNFQATNSGLTYSDRTLETHYGKGELLIDVMDYKNTWLEEQMGEGLTKSSKTAIPFAQSTWDQIMAKAGEDLNLNTVWDGVYNPAGTTAKDIADGFNTILKREITAGKVSPVGTGALTAGDAVAKVEELYKSQDPRYRDMDMFAYMSYASYDAYVEDYRQKHGTKNTYDKFLQQAIDHSNGRCRLKPAIWMGDSDRVIITPKENLLGGTNRLDDLHKINIVEDVWTLKAGFALNVGFQFRDLEVLKVNDAA